MPCWEYIVRDLPRCTHELENGRGCPSPGTVCDSFTRRLYCGHHAPVTNESRSAKVRERQAVKRAVRRAYAHLWRPTRRADTAPR